MEATNQKQESIYKSEELIESGGWLNEILWICAGVDRKVLRQCPTDYAKYAGIGGTILFTALMATLSGGYALNFVFDNFKLAVAFGIFWGLLIFNLDRFIVNTMYSDGKPTISRMEILSGLPRIIMAIFLGIVISTPLELKIFEDAIDIRIEQDKDELVKTKIGSSINERDSISKKREEILKGVSMFDSQIITSNYTTNEILSEIYQMQSDLNIVNTKISNLNMQIANIETRFNQMDRNDPNRSRDSINLRNIRGQRSAEYAKQSDLMNKIRIKQGEAGASDDYLKNLLDRKQTETQKEAERLQNEVDSLNRKINDANVRHHDWSKEEIMEKGSFRDKLDVNYKGFQAKMTSFNELKNESFATKISSWFIMMLFIIIEIVPTFFKMMMTSGPYDDLLRAEMHRVRVLSDKRISDINDIINTEVKISTQSNKGRLEAEVQANKKLLEQIATVQVELLQTAIDKWREEELAKINENPSNYIKTNENT